MRDREERERWRTVSQVADAALDLPAPERAAFIDRRCGGDAELQRDVRRYVDACERATHAPGFLAGAAGTYAEGMLQDLAVRTTRAEGAVRESLNDALRGRYTLERELGRGGMAMVFVARDERHDTEVAIKVLRPALARELAAQRFLREVRILSELRHDHVVPLLDSGDAAGLLYYVMPYIRGESLAQLLARERQIPLDRALPIARDAASALDYAHARGIVHRDVKPANILLDAGGARVADFGVARAIVEASGERLTATGIVVGTSAYMSPEQAMSDSTLDGRSDVYSLACVVYEMLGGVAPFTGATPQIVLAKHLRTPVPSIRDLAPQLTHRTSRALEAGLAKDPSDRFASAGTFVRALEASQS